MYGIKKRIILKPDQESVMNALQTQVKRKWDGEILPRFSPVGQSAANGLVETAIHEGGATLRTMLLALEWRPGHKIPFESHNIVGSQST